MNLSVSRFIAEAMQREIRAGWPEGYFEKVIGRWQGDLEELKTCLSKRATRSFRCSCSTRTSA